MIATAIMNGFFQTITTVSGSPSSEQGCTSTYAYLESVLISSLMPKMDSFAVSFVADIER